MSKELNAILLETREFKSFSLGHAYGCYSFYKDIKNEYGAEKAKSVFRSYWEEEGQTGKYFMKFVRADEESESKSEEIYMKMKKFL